jgi:serine/threonine-protein kinase RsbW
MLKKIKIESIVNNLRIVENAIDEATNEIGISQDNYGKILISTIEAVNNAILHGNDLDTEKVVVITINFNGKDLKIKVIDQGEGFRPGEVPDPTVPEKLETVNGRGVFIMSRLADKIQYNKKGNSVTMIFKNIIS